MYVVVSSGVHLEWINISRKTCHNFLWYSCVLYGRSDSMVFGIYFYFEKKKSVMQEKLGEVF